MLTLVQPSPPSRTRVKHLAVGFAKGITLDLDTVKQLTRSETCSRKEGEEEESFARRDVEFLIATGRSKLRAVTGEVLSVKREVEREMKISIFHEPSPPRQVHRVAEHRTEVLAHRTPPTKITDAIAEELELRNWVARLEENFRSTLASMLASEWAFVTRFFRCEDSETKSRKSIETAEHDAWRRLAKSEFLDRPLFNKPPEVPKELTFDEIEEDSRTQIVAEENAGRIQCHEWLVLRYGVQLFSVNRVEDIFRQEIEESFTYSCAFSVNAFLHQHYRCSMLALCAIHANPVQTPLLVGATIVTGNSQIESTS